MDERVKSRKINLRKNEFIQPTIQIDTIPQLENYDPIFISLITNSDFISGCQNKRTRNAQCILYTKWQLVIMLMKVLPHFSIGDPIKGNHNTHTKIKSAILYFDNLNNDSFVFRLLCTTFWCTWLWSHWHFDQWINV